MRCASETRRKRLPSPSKLHGRHKDLDDREGLSDLLARIARTA
jgi:hypothetical protein